MSIESFLTNLFGLQGQTAVVIGGAGELGGALTAGLMQAGAHVVIGDRECAFCDKRLDKLREISDNLSCATIDVTSRASIENCLAESLKVSGKVDILINCAGMNAGTSFLDVDPDLWDTIFAVNLKGMMEACQIFITSMLETGGGSILNIGSVTSILPLSRVYAYAASKAGVVNLTQNIAQEFGEQGIRCNAICPGFFPAEQNKKLLDAERVENIMRNTPMNRYGTPDELVGAALLLLSKNAGSYMTGSSVCVDGGFTCSWF